MSTAENLVPGVSHAPQQSYFPPRLNVYRRDRSNAATTLVSVNRFGTAGGNGDSIPAGISADGRYALIESAASDLVANDTNGMSDVVVRDLVTGTNILVSCRTNGLPGNGDSHSAVMTPDGRFVAFVSTATNLVTGDINGIADVFVRDLVTGVTRLVSVGAKSTSTSYALGSSEAPEITPDGRYVAFYSTATNLVAGVRTTGDIYVRDLVSGTTTWASSGARAALQSVQNNTNGVCFSHVISADGRYVAFETSLVVGATNPTTGLVLSYDLQNGLTEIVNTNAAVLAGPAEDSRQLALTPDGRFLAFVANTNGTSGGTTCVQVWDAWTSSSTLVSGDAVGLVQTNSRCGWPAITPDGRFVVFLSTATNLVTNVLSGEFQVYLRDLQSSNTILVGSGGTPTTLQRLSDDGRFVAFEAYDGDVVPHDSNQAYDVFLRDSVAEATELISSHDPALPSLSPAGPSTLSLLSVSAEGRYLAFASEAKDLVANDTNGCRDVFVRDRLLGTNVLVSVAMSGVAPANGVSSEPSISADGRFVAFSSIATNLVAGDTNRAADVFLRDLQTGTTTLVSVNTNGDSGGNRDSYAPVVSGDGQAVLFHSKANNLAPGLFGNSVDNLFRRDLTVNTTVAVTAFTSGYTGIGLIPTATTSDGRYVAFGSPTAAWYVWDSQVGARIYTNTVAAGSPVRAIGISQDGNRVAYASATNLHLVDRSTATNLLLGRLPPTTRLVPQFSGDGRFLAYSMTNSSTSDTNGLLDVYLYDLETGSNALVSQAFNGASANGSSDSARVSWDGRFVAYRSDANNLLLGDTNNAPDVFLWDRLTGATTLLSLAVSGVAGGNNRSLTPVFSGDGATVFLESWASDIGETDFNRASDVFAVSLLSFGVVPPFSAEILVGGGVNEGVWISWPVVAGKSYRVQFKNQLTDPDWQNLGRPVVLVGDRGYLNDAALTRRFYRVVAF